MALTQIQQIHQLLEDKKHVLITFRSQYSSDSVASALALALFLKKIGKRVDIVSDQFSLPKQLSFLKQSEVIQSRFRHLQKFIVTIDVAKTGLNELSYDVKDEKLRIFITPKEGFLTRDQIRTAQTDFKYDMIMVIDSPDLSSLGSLYENNSDLFFQLPILNIDHAPHNEQFGHINIVDITKVSTAEVVYELLNQLGAEYIDEPIATALLTGMIANTRSFKTEHVKPTTLTTASKLMSLGAKREYIVQHLYRTKTIATLKLWGQALAHLTSYPDLSLVSTSITREDFSRSGATEHDLYDIVDELIANAPEAKLILLLHEHARQENGAETIHAFLHTTKDFDAKLLTQPFHPEGERQRVTFTLQSTSLKEAEDKIITTIREQQKQ